MTALLITAILVFTIAAVIVPGILEEEHIRHPYRIGASLYAVAVACMFLLAIR